MSDTKEFNTSTQKSHNKIDGIKPVQQNIFNAALNNKPEPVKTKTSPNKSLNPKNNPKTPDTIVPPSEPKTNPKTANNLLAKSLEFGQTLIKSFGYSAYESPLLGLSQIVKTATNVNIEKYLPQVEAQQPSQFGTSNWYASQMGSGLGIALDFMLTDKLMGSKIDNLANTDIASSATAKVIGRSAVSGAIYEGVFSPSNVIANHNNLLTARVKQAFSGALTFGAMAGVSTGLRNLTFSLEDKNILAKVVNNNLVNGVASGSIGGLVNVNTDSILNGHGLASFKNDVQTTYAYSVAGVPLGLAHVFSKPEDTLTSSYGSKEYGLNQLNPENIAASKIVTDQTNSLDRTQGLFDYRHGFDQDKSIKETINDSNGKQVATINFTIPAIPQIPDVTEYINPKFLDQIKSTDFTQSKSVSLDNGLNLLLGDKGVVNAHFKDGTQLKLGSNGDIELTLNDGSKLQKFVRFNHNDDFYRYFLPNGKIVEFSPKTYLRYFEPKDRSDKITLHHNGDLHFESFQDNQYSFYHETRSEQGLTIKARQNNNSFTRHSNGLTETKLLDGTDITSFQGNTITTYPDGTEITRLNDGSIKTRDLSHELKDSVSKVIAKFNSDDFSRQDYDLILKRFDENQKPLAKALLDLSLPNMSVKKFIDNIKASPELVEKELPKRLVVKNTSSSGNAIAYLYRKALGIDEDIVPINELDAKDNLKTIYFDNLENLSCFELDELNNYKTNLSIFDTNNFDKGINFIDVANDNVYPKLKGLVDLAQDKKLASADGQFLSPNDIAYKILNEDSDTIAKKNSLKLLRPLVQSSDVLLEPAVSSESMDNFFRNAQYKTFYEKLTASNFLANDTRYHTVRSMLDKAKTLYAAIGYNIDQEKALRFNRQVNKNSFDYTNPEDSFTPLKNLKYVVGLDGLDGAGSSAFINYIFKVANSIPDSKFLTRSNLGDYLNDSANLPLRSIVLLDDTAYSGTQLEEKIEDYFAQHKNKLIIGLYGSYRNFEERLRTAYNKSPKHEPALVVLESHLSVKDKTSDNINHTEFLTNPMGKDFNEIISRLKLDYSMRRFIEVSTNFGDVNSSIVWPYMTPDTSLGIIKKFGRLVLGFRDDFDD